MFFSYFQVRNKNGTTEKTEVTYKHEQYLNEYRDSFGCISAWTGVNLIKAEVSQHLTPIWIGNYEIMKFEIRDNVKSTTVHLCGWEMRMCYLIFLIFFWNWKMERKVINGSRVEIVSSVKIASKCVGSIDWKMGQVHKWDKEGLRLVYRSSN